MMQKLERLTPEQEADLLAWREEWYAIGSACGPSDRERTQETISAMYAAIGKPSPQYIFCQSPVTCMLGTSFFKEGDSLRNSLGNSLRDSLWDSLRNSLGDSLWDSLGNSLGNSLRDSLRDFFYGAHESYWIAYYLFMPRISVYYAQKDVLRLSWWATLAQSCGWWLAYEHVCFVADRPSVQHVDEQRRLHCATGPAMAFGDGYSLWAWHGVRVPQRVIEQPETLTIEEIHAEPNAEIRRVMIEQYGWDRLMDADGATLIAADTEPVGAPGLRGLFRLHDGAQVLVCSCASSGHTFYLEVPLEVESCQQAANWLANTNDDGLKYMLTQT